MSRLKILRYNEGKCARCSEDGVGYNDDGDMLCEDCMFEEVLGKIEKVERARDKKRGGE